MRMLGCAPWPHNQIPTSPRIGDATPRRRTVSRSHGATSASDPSNVSGWLSVILNQPHMPLSDLMPVDEVGRITQNLAQAEVRLVAAKKSSARQGSP